MEKNKAHTSLGRLLPVTREPPVAHCLWEQDRGCRRYCCSAPCLPRASPAPVSCPLRNSCRQAATVVAHTVVLTHVSHSFCFSLCCQCDKAVGLYDGCSLSLCGYTGVLVCFKKTKLIFGWQLLNCTVPLCAVGTARAECFSQPFH